MPKRFSKTDSGLIIPAPEVWLPSDPWRRRSLVDSRRMMSRRRCCCDQSPCENCVSTPAQILVKFVNVTNGTCSSCTTFDDLSGFVCDDVSVPGNLCKWVYDFPDAVCFGSGPSNPDRIIIYLQPNPTNLRWLVLVIDKDEGSLTYFQVERQTSDPPPIDYCNTLSNYEVSGFPQGFGPLNKCNYTSPNFPAAYLTAL